MIVRTFASRLSGRPLPIALWLLAAVWLSACSPSVPELAPLSRDATILAFGDSLTHGTGTESQHSYPAVLEKLTGRTVINAGVPGEVSANGADRLPRILDRHHPDLLILCHGGNDILRNNAGRKTRENVERMLRTALDRDIAVVLIGVPEKTLLLHSAPFYGELAGKYNVPVEDEILAQVLGDRSLKSDPIHPNAQGYRNIAQAVFELLQGAGAVD